MIDKILALLPWLLALILLTWMVNRSRKRSRSKRINSFEFPPSLNHKVIAKYPHLTAQQAEEVIQGLREYFHICNHAGKKVVSMPSQAVDVAWHEFILFTRHYEYFCRKALGRFLHHTPAEAMKSPTMAEQGIKTAWNIACIRENINPKSPKQLPLLFELDSKLHIPDGFKYTLNCKHPHHTGENVYCASHIGCGSSSGCSSGCSASSCSSGCGGGD